MGSRDELQSSCLRGKHFCWLLGPSVLLTSHCGVFPGPDVSSLIIFGKHQLTGGQQENLCSHTATTLHLEGSVEKYLVVQWYSYVNKYFLWRNETLTYACTFYLLTKNPVFERLSINNQWDSNNPQIIRYLWMHGPFEEPEFLFASIQRFITVNIISGSKLVVFFLSRTRNVQIEFLFVTGVGWEQNLNREILCKWFTEVRVSGESRIGWGSGLVLGKDRSTEVADRRV